jgi:Cu(I)/Ag(I) efflux system periplasmic protein CusF
MKFSVFVFATALLLSAASFAQTGKTEGEVRKVDKETGKVTLRHVPIDGELDMPAMSMVFQVKDASLLDILQVGDRVAATISKENDIFYIQSAEKK